MSADRIYCYAPQRRAVVQYLHEIGAQVTSRSPWAIVDAASLQGLKHINFIVIEGSRDKVPNDIWEMLRVQGAVVLRIDDHFARERFIINVQTLPEAKHAG
jgi:hypothetical protein